MEDRFIGYRGSQENEWSWEPESTTGPGASARHRPRTFMFAAVATACVVAIVAAAAYLIAGTGGGGNGAAANASTPTHRPTASLTAAPTTMPATVAPTMSPSPSPSAVSTTPPRAPRLFVWNSTSGKWQADDLRKDASRLSEGSTVLFLYRLEDVVPGKTYDVAIDYFNCGLSPGRAFDYLGAMPPAADAAQTAAPGPRRTRPDAQVPVPDDPNLTVDDAAGSFLTLWGGTFPHSPALEPLAGDCAGDKKLAVQVTARSKTMQVEWAAHLASGKDWPGGGASSASASFGVGVTSAGVADARIQIAPGAVSK